MTQMIFVWMFLGVFHAALSTYWPIRRKSFIDGDFILGGFFPIHGIDNDMMCGKLQEEGLTELEAMLFTVGRINNDSAILPGIQLGVLAVDSCDSVPGALQEAVDFAKGFIVRDDAKRKNESRRFMCEGNTPAQYEEGIYDKVVAIIGGHSSWVSMQVADLMRIYKVPQVSYQSTNPLLSDLKRFEYFFRTVPPLGHQALAILDILKEFNWTYVSVVYADSNYGNEGFEVLKREAPDHSVCFSLQQRINVANSNEKDYDSVIEDLLDRNATAVILFGDHEMARNLISAATRAQVYGRFAWIGSTYWLGREYVTSGNELTMEGAIGISHDIKELRNFDDYLNSRKLNDHRKINPWFPEYWEDELKCKLEDFYETPFNVNYTEACPPDATPPPVYYMSVSPTVQSVRDAVYAVAHALDDMIRDKCPGSLWLCNDMMNVDGEELREYLKKVQFEDEENEIFRFDANGDGPPRYVVLNFQKLEAKEEYAWIRVGKYFYLSNNEPRLELNKEALRYKHNKSSFPQSLCSAPCKVGQAMIFLDDDSCCWHCTNCSEFQYVEEETNCRDCPLGSLPSHSRNSCEPLALQFMDFENPWACACIVFSVLGILITACVAGALGKYWDTPIFIVSGRELSSILLIGIFLSFCLTFAIVSKPSPLSCGIVRFFLGFCHTISYATIAAKIRQISRLQKLQDSKKKPKPINTKSLWLVAMALIAVEGTINATWLIHSPPATDYQYPSRQENVFICKGSDTAGYLVGLVYPFLLMVFCTIYAFKIRDFIGAFYESRYINFTNYTIFVVWLAFLPMFLLNKNNFLRVVVLSLLLNLTALVQLVCLFMPKVYIAIRRPEKNKHENVMCYDMRQSSQDGIDG